MDHENDKPAEWASTWQGLESDDLLPTDVGKGKTASRRMRFGVVFPRLLIGLIVLICAEVFSGASLGVGLWNPWTLVVTYWLYFAHFFFFTTLAIQTGRTSFWALYLWGILFGLYESWITKVIWYGYSGDGKFAMGHIGPFGFSEMSMVFIFHPVMSFILPLAVACLLCPPLRRFFPDLAWLTGASRGARSVQIYLVASLAPVVGMNSGGPANLARNVVFLLVVLALLVWLRDPALPLRTAVRSRPSIARDSSGSASTSQSCTRSVTSSSDPMGYPRSTCSYSHLSSMGWRSPVSGCITAGNRSPIPARPSRSSLAS